MHEMVSRARAAGVLHLSLALDPGDPLVLGDPDAIKQLVTDLLVVAAHTVAGGSPLQVETRTEAGPPSRVVVAISSLGHAPDLSERHQRILDEHGGAIETRSSPAPLTLLLSFPAPPLGDLLPPA